MKNLKKSIFGLAILTSSIGLAQETSYEKTLKVGINAGYSIPQENLSYNIGLDLGYQHLVTPKIGLGFVTGYNQFLERTSTEISNNKVGLVPVAFMFRYYPRVKGIYAGANAGYGFLFGDERVASNYTTERPIGGLYLNPEIGYHNIHWNFALQYTKLLTNDIGNIGSQKYSVGSLGISVAYNIALTKKTK